MKLLSKTVCVLWITSENYGTLCCHEKPAVEKVIQNILNNSMASRRAATRKNCATQAISHDRWVYPIQDEH